MSDIEFELSEEQRLVRKTVQGFAEKEVKPLARKVDAEHYFPAELIPKLGALGFMGIMAPSSHGGSDLDTVSYTLIIEELARFCASTSVIVSAHNSLCVGPIAQFGTEEQKQKYLPKLCSGEWLGCFCLSEPGTGSDAANQTCLAKREGKRWKLDGVKNWITNGPVAKIGIVFAMERPELGSKGINCFIVDLKETSGVSIGKKEEKLGICGSPTANITFEGAEISNDQLLGEPGEGFKIAMTVLDGGRCGIAAQATGIAEAALQDSIIYAKERKTFGKPIAEHQSVGNYLAEMSARIHAARYLTLTASKRKDAGQPFSQLASEAKLLASDTAMYAARQAIQIHGGYGYVKDFNVERYYRDAKITEIYEGTSEIQKLVIARHLLR